MSSALHIRKSDKVVILSGNYRNCRGEVTAVNRKAGRAVVRLDRDNERAKRDPEWGFIKKAARKSEARPQGGFMMLDPKFYVSKLMKAEQWDQRASKRTGGK